MGTGKRKREEEKEASQAVEIWYPSSYGRELAENELVSKTVRRKHSAIVIVRTTLNYPLRPIQ